MHRKVRQYLKKSLCGILSAAMILTSLSVPDMTVHATEASVSEETEETLTSESTETAVTESSDTKETEEAQTKETSTKSTESETEEISSTVDEKETEKDTSAKKDNKDSKSKESEEEETEDIDSVEVNEPDENGNYIVNGDFSDDSWGSGETEGKLGGWGFAGDTWTVVGDGNIAVEDGAKRGGSGMGMKLWYGGDNGGTVEVYQTIASLPAGKYKMTAWMKEPNKETKVKLYHGTDTSISGTGVSAGTENTVNAEWGEISYEFTLDAPKTNYNVGFAVTSQNGAWVCIDDVSLVCTEPIEVNYTLEQLSQLCDEIQSLIDGKTSDDYKAGWDELNTALNTAKSLITASSTDTAQITSAYNELTEAKAALKRADVTVTFFYHAEQGKKLGIRAWDKGGITLPSDKWTDGNWHLGDGWEASVCLMTEDEKYAGWYSMEITFDPNIEEDGFQIFSSDSSDTSDTPVAEEKAKYGYTTAVYEKLISGKAKSYAVDGSKIYQGTKEGTENLLAAIERNVILHVYAEDGAPAIGIDSGSKLFTVDNSTGEISEITADNTTTEKKYYNMEPDDPADNWYTLTFSAPENENGAVCGLYDSAQNLLTNFVDKNSEAENTVDFTPVFDGSCYYKNGKFYSSKAFADGVSLEKLQELYDQADALDAARYTEESWAVLTEKKAAAKQLLDDKSTDTAAITSAYDELSKAIDDLVSAGVRLYYYAGDTQGKGVGIYFYDDNQKILSTTAQEASWKPWGTMTVYEMEACGYSGWYSIPITFDGDETKAANLQVFIEENNTPVFKCGTTDDVDNKDIYTKLFAGEQSAYAVKLFGETAKLYEGSDAETAMRSITLYAYCSTGVPAIGSAGKLQAVNESTGAIEVKETAADNNVYYYQMAAVQDKNNWYSLTFCMPDAASSDIGLYTYADNTYTLAKKLTQEDIQSVFDGSIYYRDKIFYESMEYAEGITLKQLKELLASPEVTAIVENGADKYTPDSWEAFNTAKTGADAVVAECGQNADTNKDDYKSTKITEAYSALQAAVTGIEEKENVVTFYYYNNSIAADDELGLVFWGGDQSYSTAETYTDWHIWSAGDAYKLTKVDGYTGWYSIPMVFMPAVEGKDPGFEIHKKSDAANALETYSSYNNNYPVLTGGETAYAVKNGKSYQGEELVNLLMRNVTLYAYSAEGVPSVGTPNEITAYVDERTGNKVTVSRSAQTDGINYYDMKAAEDEDWYVLKFSAPSAADTKEIGKLYTKKDSAYSAVITLLEGVASAENTVDFTQYFGRTVYFKNGRFYDSLPITIEDLKSLIEKAVKLKEDDLKAEEEGRKPKYLHDNDEGRWAAFISEIDKAKAVADKTGPQDSEIEEAYRRLDAAMGALVYIPQNAESISVERVAVPDGFITGADLSSYVSLKESGTVFKDADGNALSDSDFFKMLYEGGTNWVRIRVWNDPYNSNGNGYGGGNSDLDKAKIIGKLATDAGMRVLIDFHYSDFWADPAKQETPKAWEDYTLEQKEEAVYNFTLNSLRTLKSSGVDVGMVQVGNETNNGICGEKGWANMSKIFNAGSRAVRDFDKSCLVAVHFADPSDGNFSSYSAQLDANSVDYDVFAASYYPFWHGTTDNLINKLAEVANNYGKKVMVAETSWVTTWDDGDGHGNTSPKTSQTLDYPVSVQGQADEMRAVINAVNTVNGRVNGNPAIGVFYWEPAWISPYYAYNGDSLDEQLYSKNKELWEKYGSGWASSYSAEYDPSDAGLWYGGSAVDNQAWFDFNGQALETAKVYSYIRTGAVAESRINAIANVERELELNLKIGSEIKWPDGSQIEVTFNDGTKAADNEEYRGTHLKSTKVKWDELQQALVTTDKVAQYTVNGTVTCEYYEKDGDPETIKTGTYKIVLTVKVTSNSNILVNSGFEQGQEPWIVTPLDATAGNAAGVTSENPHSGDLGMHFWSSEVLHFTVEQRVLGLKEGSYTFGGFLQGGGASSKDVQTLYATVVDEKGVETVYKQTCSLNGFLNWVNPEITNIKISSGDTLIVGMEIQSSIAGAWGTIDDMYLYGKYGIKLNESAHGTVNVSNMEPDSGEIVRISAIPENGYYLSELKVSGENGLGSDFLKDETGIGTVTYDAESKTATITYKPEDIKGSAAMSAYFVMPDDTVELSAVFRAVGFTSPIALSEVYIRDFEKTAEGKEVYKENVQYTGSKIELNLELSYAGYVLTSSDYSVTYTNNKNISSSSMAQITLKAKGNKFTGTRTLYFNIVDTKVDISKAKAKLAKAVYYYTGDEIEPVITEITDKDGRKLKAKDNTDMDLSPETDYAVYFEKNIKVGKATMIVIARGESEKIKGAFTQTFTISKCPITSGDITVTGINGGTYTGSKITPNITVKHGNKILKKGADYTVSYKNNVKAYTGTGTKATLKIIGKGSYTGTTREYPFEIMPKNLNDFDIKVTAGAIAEGAAPKIIVKNGTKTLSLNKQYIITEIARDAEGDNDRQVIYAYNEKTGKPTTGTKPTAAIRKTGAYTAVLKGSIKGGYTGELTVPFKVVGKDKLLSNAKITIKPATRYYTGSEVTLKAQNRDNNDYELSVTDKNGNKLYVDEDYTVSYSNADGVKTNIKAGKATVTIVGMGNYAGSKSAKFTISPKVIASKDIKWTPKEDTMLEQMQQNKKEDGILYLPYTGYAWKPELNIYVENKLLTEKTDYTISYKKNQKTGDAAKVIIKGKGNYKGTVNIEKVFTIKDVTLDDFIVTINPVEYSGKALKPALNFVYKETGTTVALKAGTAYKVKYKNNKKVAGVKSANKPTAEITEKGLNAKGSKKVLNLYFTITSAKITPESIGTVKVQTFKGKPVKPTLTIKVNGRKLKAGKDYTVTYTGNMRHNHNATAEITGIGNYYGKVSKVFVIK